MVVFTRSIYYCPQSPHEFTEEYNNITSSGSYGGTSYATSEYDSVWVIAHALHNTEQELQRTGSSLVNFTYQNDAIRDAIFRHVNNTKITGVSVGT